MSYFVSIIITINELKKKNVKIAIKARFSLLCLLLYSILIYMCIIYAVMYIIHIYKSENDPEGMLEIEFGQTLAQLFDGTDAWE